MTERTVVLRVMVVVVCYLATVSGVEAGNNGLNKVQRELSDQQRQQGGAKNKKQGGEKGRVLSAGETGEGSSSTSDLPPSLPAEGFCTLCHNGTAPREATDLNAQFHLDGDVGPARSCTDYVTIFATSISLQADCAAAQYAVAHRCGCDPPPYNDLFCALCADGSPPLNPNAIIFNDDNTTTSCVDAAFSFAILPPHSNRCRKHQASLAHICECTHPLLPNGVSVCTLCNDGTHPANIDASLPEDEHGDSITCREFNTSMAAIPNGSATCTALQYQAAAPCGCPIPLIPSYNDDESYCTLCVNGVTPTNLQHLHNTVLSPAIHGKVMTCEEYAFDLMSKGYHSRDNDCITAQILAATTCGCPLPTLPQHSPVCDLCSGDTLPFPNDTPFAHVVPTSYEEDESIYKIMTCGTLQLLAAYDKSHFGTEQLCHAVQATIGQLCHCPNPPQPQCAISCSKEGYSVRMSAAFKGFSYFTNNVEEGPQKLCADVLFEMSLDAQLCDLGRTKVQEACCFPTKQGFTSSWYSTTFKVFGVAIVVVLIVLVIGRVTPSFVWNRVVEVVARKKKKTSSSLYGEVTCCHDSSSTVIKVD